MLRILYVTDSLVAGGTEQQLITLISGLDRTRICPVVLCLYGDKSGRPPHYLPHLEQLGVEIVMVDSLSKLRLITTLIRVIWKIRPQLVQMVNYHSNLLVRLARPLLPRPLKLVGCIYVEYTRKQLLYERLSAWLCAALVCNSTAIQAQLQRYIRTEVTVIPNGIDLLRFNQGCAVDLRAKYGASNQRILLFMGRIAVQKSPHLIVEALGLLQRRNQLPENVRLWIVGECTEPQAQDLLEAAVNRFGLSRIVRQFEASEHPECFYQDADIVALPSLWEGLPNVVLESLAAGRPVIVSEAANSEGIIQAGVNGWIVPTGDVQSLAVAIHDALISLETGRFCSEADLRESVAGYSAERMVTAYDALYRQLNSS